MTNPHEKAIEDRRKAGEELMDAYDAVCEAADLYEPEE
jgi:hypothetical protein